MSMLVRAVRLIDGVSPTSREPVDVVVDGRFITLVGDHDPARPVTGTTVVEGQGRTLLPGLIDAHAHYTFDPTEGSLQAIALRSDEAILADGPPPRGARPAAGVTTARGAGSIRNLECMLRDEIAAGQAVGPRIVAAGTAVGSIGGHGSAFGLRGGRGGGARGRDPPGRSPAGPTSSRSSPRRRRC